MSFTDRLTARDERIKTLENTCKDLAKDLGDALKAGAENVRDYQKFLADAQKEIATLTFEATLSPSFFRAKCKVLTVENTQLKQQIESANKLLDEKIKAWDEAYSLEANDLQWAASVDLEAVKTILFPRNREQKQEENSVELLHRYRNEYAEQGNEENKENTTP